MVGKTAQALFRIRAGLRSSILEKTIISQDGSFLWGGKTMDPRVHEVMRMLRKQALTHRAGNSHAAISESDNKEEQKMSLEEIAIEFDLSESRLRALFKSQVGLPPTQYVKKLKMDEAARLLRDSYRRVTEIRTRLRINDYSHFVRDFKKAHGMTPIQYRKFYQRQSEREGGAEGDNSV